MHDAVGVAKPEAEGAELGFVLGLACTASDRPTAGIAAAVERVLLEIPGDSPEVLAARLVGAAQRVGLTAVTLQAVWADAVSGVSPRCPLFQFGPDGPIAFVERRDRRTRVVKPDGTEEWVDDPPGTESLTWWVVEATLAFRADTDEHEGHYHPTQFPLQPRFS